MTTYRNGIAAHSDIQFEQSSLAATERKAKDDDTYGVEPKATISTTQVQFEGKLHHIGTVKLENGEVFDAWSPIPPAEPPSVSPVRQNFRDYIRVGKPTVSSDPFTGSGWKEYLRKERLIRERAEQTKVTDVLGVATVTTGVDAKAEYEQTKARVAGATHRELYERAKQQLKGVNDHGQGQEEGRQEVLTAQGSPAYLALLEQMADLHRRKSAGYAGDNPDPWANFRECERMGIAILDGLDTRMSDKWVRFCNLRKNTANEQVGESLRDTLMDLASYALIRICLMDETKES